MTHRARKAAKVLAAVLVTIVGGYFAMANGLYGAIGAYSAFEEHLEWSTGAIIYWILLFIAAACVFAIIGTWMLVLKRDKSNGP
jgi:hypothetical protein